MIVNSERTIALTCPACQVIQEHAFSLFTVSRQPLQLLCGCGFSQGHLRRLKGNFELDVLGADGDRVHLLFSSKEVIHDSLINIFSPKNEQKLGYLGNSQEVKDVVLADHQGFFPDSGNFSNPEIMGRVLEKLRDLAEQHKISCQCEHPSIGIDVYSDKVELVCSYCGSMMLISASNRKHQERMSRVTEIIMEPCTSQFLEEWLKPLT